MVFFVGLQKKALRSRTVCFIILVTIDVFEERMDTKRLFSYMLYYKKMK
jgi:hypothetical protein